MNVSALNEVHRREARSIDEYHGWQLPTVYSSLEAEIESVVEGAGLIDLSCFGRLEITGSDRVDLLHRLSTNDLLTAQTGDTRSTILLTDKGRLVDSLILAFEDDRIHAVVSPGAAERVIAWIGKYTITEDIALSDITSLFSMISLVGCKAFSMYESIFSESLTDGSGCMRRGEWGSHIALATRHNGLEVVHMIAEQSTAPGLWEHIAEQGRGVGVSRLGTSAFEAIRIAFGIPSSGTEITESFNPFEVGLKDQISFTKGCYIGQEVVARLDTYGKVQKTLVGLKFEPESPLPDQGAELFLANQAVGTVTSVFSEQIHGRSVGLGVVRLAASAKGTMLISRRGSPRADVRVETLPMPI